MKSVIAGGMLLEPGDPRGIWFREELSLPNPAFVAWVKHGRGAPPEERVTCVGRQDGGPWEGGAIVPRYHSEVSGVDRMVMPDAPRLEFRGTLRDAAGDQRDAARAVKANGGGIIQAGCGSGKTVCGLEIIADTPTPAIVLVHTSDLAKQWVDQAKLFLGIDAAVIGYGKGVEKADPSARLTVGSLQTLARLSWWDMHQLGKRWGLAVADECHHIPAQSFALVMSGLSGRMRVGLTATPKRADGLTPWLEWIVGPTVARINPSVLEAAGKILAPEIRRVYAPDYDGDGRESYERDADLSEHPERNRLIVDEAAQCVKDGRKVLVLVKLVAHAYTLAERLRDVGIDAVALVGEVKKKDREATIARMRSGKVEVVIATSLADEGLDAPRLDACILAVPEGNVAKVEQRVGRVCRPHPEALPPLVIDVVDSWGPYQGYARRRMGLYRSRQWVR